MSFLCFICGLAIFYLYVCHFSYTQATLEAIKNEHDIIEEKRRMDEEERMEAIQVIVYFKYRCTIAIIQTLYHGKDT